jgi:hypothetical protein
LVMLLGSVEKHGRMFQHPAISYREMAMCFSVTTVGPVGLEGCENSQSIVWDRSEFS